MSYITFKNICKSYDNKTQVLKGIDLEVEEGELLTLLGPSGCGKSTLLRCLAGLEQVQQGHILLEGRDITDLDARQRQIGMVFQQYSLSACLSAASCSKTRCRSPRRTLPRCHSYILPRPRPLAGRRHRPSPRGTMWGGCRW